MKTDKIILLLAFLMACAGLYSCSDSDNEEPAVQTATLTCSVSSLDFTHEGGSLSFTLETNMDWTARVASTAGGAVWCTLSSESGQAGKHTIRVDVTGNDGTDDRSVSITIQAGTLRSTVVVTQKQKDALTVTSDKLEIGAEGGDVSLTVKANIAYEVIIDEACREWLSEKARTRVLQSRTHTFTVAPSEEYDVRTGTIYVRSGDMLETVQVFQAGSSILLLTPGEMYVESAGGTVTVELKTNCDFDVEMPAADWIAAAPASRAMSSHTLRYTVLPNEGYDSREAEIRFYDKERPEQVETLRIVQAQRDAIIISRTEMDASPSGETIEVELSSNVTFTTEILPAGTDWITAVPQTRGLSVSRLRYAVAANETGESREARIVFVNEADKDVADTLIVRQAAPGPHALFLSRKEVCVVKGNSVLFTYDKATQQYYHAPARGIYRILDDEGTRHITLTLPVAPTAAAPADGTVTDGWGLGLPASLPQVQLLQETDELIWLWSDEAETGFILPKL